jgi:predicted transcriptional regulator
METFTPPPYREKRPHGRQPIHSPEMRLMIGKKVSEKEMTYREAAKMFGISGGAVAGCVKLYLNKDKNKNRTPNYHAQNDEVANYRHQAQVKDLKHQIADLFLENQMLKKILNKSLQIKKDNGSVITTNNLAQFQKDAE